MKKWISVVFAVLAVAGVLSGLKSVEAQTTFDDEKSITVLSREEGSGTRSTFIELFKIEAKTADGKKKDMTTKEAGIANNTDLMLKSIISDQHSIGYISVGAINNKVKALKINGVAPTLENVKNGSYRAIRPFYIATKALPKGLTKDFIDFIFSADGQAIVSKNYMPVVDKGKPYAGKKPAGKIIVGGSSSVTPLMEKLKEAYLVLNPNATIEIHMSNSNAGMAGVFNGTYDMGMASRSLSDKENDELKRGTFAMDGIAVIVNKKNITDTLTHVQAKNIFIGKTTRWNEVTK